MEPNYTVLAIATFVNFALSAIWYTPLFGKRWGEIIGTMDRHGKLTKLGEVMCDEVNLKSLMPKQIVTQLVLTLMTNFILYKNVLGWGDDTSPVAIAVIIWVGFVFPLSAGDVLWSALSNRLKWWKLFIQSGIWLISLIVGAVIFSTWG